MARLVDVEVKAMVTSLIYALQFITVAKSGCLSLLSPSVSLIQSEINIIMQLFTRISEHFLE